jgi:hypothetical protein
MAGMTSLTVLQIMQGAYGPAIAHLQSGSKILCEIQYDEERRTYHHGSLMSSPIPYVPMQSLEELLIRLDLQMTQVS